MSIATMKVKAWTDYPFLPPHDDEVVRQVFITNYDGNIYCTIEYKGKKYKEIKSGYLYKERGKFGEVPCFMHRDLLALAKDKSHE